MTDSIVLFSHDGYGLGHLRRNVLIAEAIVKATPNTRPVIVTGVSRTPAWLENPAFEVVRVPSLQKDGSGNYVNTTMSTAAAVDARGLAFERVIANYEPRAVIVDRHPLGIAGELRRGLSSARRNGAAITLGLRDILDDPFTVRSELRGDDWRFAPAFYDQVLVYGHREVCDHRLEYGAGYTATYCGWVVETPTPQVVDNDLILITAGGGGDGDDIVRLGIDLLVSLPNRRGLIVAGPFAQGALHALPAKLAARVQIVESVPHCAPLYASSGAVIQMAGYNSVAESLAAGARPLLLPRRAPRREQAIRASRLSALGLADVIDHGSTAEEIGWWLRRPRRLQTGELARLGMDTNGATSAANALLGLVGSVAA